MTLLRPWPAIAGRVAFARRPLLLFSLGVAVAALVLLWSAMALVEQRDAADAAAAEAARCRSLADQVVALRGDAAPQLVRAPQNAQAPQTEGSAPSGQTEWLRLVSDAAATAGIEDRDLDRIEPQAVRRAAMAERPRGRAPVDEAAPPAQANGGGDGPMEQATQVAVRRATLEQLVRFLHALSTAPGGACVRQLRLAVPGGAPGTAAAPGTAEEWSADVTLTRAVPPVAQGPPPSAEGAQPSPAQPTPVRRSHAAPTGTSRYDQR